MEIKFHDIGEGMTEGEILHYFVKVGDEVQVDEPLVEVQTDKMVAEIPSPAAGKIVRILPAIGDVVSVGMTIIEISNDKTSAAQMEGQQDQQAAFKEMDNKSTDQPAKIAAFHGQIQAGVLAAPYSRKIAKDHQIDIETITGTGTDGRVTEEDVYAAISANTEPSPTKNNDNTIPFRGIRKQIAKNMMHSKNVIPHVTHYEEVDVTNLLVFRKELKLNDVSVSIVAFFLKALAIALKEYPIFNAQLDEDQGVIRLFEDIHIGLATDTEKGLAVPVLHHVHTTSIRQLHERMKAQTKKAQEGRLTRNDLEGGTFTISNVGPLGGIGATPIINHPQTAIMAFHKTKKMPVVIKNDEIAIRSIMNVSLSFDHRVADGADSVRFTNRFVELIEDPKKLWIELM